MDSMQMLFSRADIVTLHVPAIEPTIGMINASVLSSFKPGATLLNFAREEIVNNDDVLAALESGQLASTFQTFLTRKCWQAWCLTHRTGRKHR